MPSIAYGSSAYKRTNGDFPELKLINMHTEAAKTSEGGVALLSRPGLDTLLTNGAGPINGLFCKAGTLSGDAFSISGSTLYREATSVGVVAGSGVASWAGGYGEILVTRGTVMRHYDGAALTDVTFPDGAGVRAVCFIGSLNVAVRADESAKFYWSDPLDGTTWDPLNFATAEREPDALLDIKPLGDNIWLFGQETIECWSLTGDATLPFSRIDQVAFDQGVLDTGCVAQADNSLVFIGSKGIVYRLGDGPVRISHNGIEERIADSTTARMFTHWREGHEFVSIRLDDGTWEYDCSTQEWCEAQSSQGNWIAAHAAMQGQTALLGHATTGAIMGFAGWDDLGEELERRFTSAVQFDGPISVDNLKLWANTGHTPLLSGQGSEPLIEMRSSDDAGNEWSAWEPASMGRQGEYRFVAEWRALGMFDFPGAMFEFRLTDPVGLRISAIKVNDPTGGRSR